MFLKNHTYQNMYVTSTLVAASADLHPTCRIPSDILDLTNRQIFYQQGFKSINEAIHLNYPIVPGLTFPRPTHIQKYIDNSELEENYDIEWELLDATIALAKDFDISIGYNDIINALRDTNPEYLRSVYGGYIDVFGIITEHLIFVSGLCHDDRFPQKLVEANIKDMILLKGLQCW